MIDDLDRKIIYSLLDDAKKSHLQIAEELGYSRSAIHQRIAKLSDKGYISGYSIDLNWQELGYAIDVYVLLSVHTKDYRTMQQSIMALSTANTLILNCYRIAGKYGFMLRVKTRDLPRLTALYDNLLQIEGVQETNTLFVLEETKNLEDIDDGFKQEEAK